MAPMLEKRCQHGTAFIEGKIIAAGGRTTKTVECFSLPSNEDPRGQWTFVRSIGTPTVMEGLLPLGKALLAVGNSISHKMLG